MTAVFTLKAGYIVFLRPFLYYSPHPVSTERLHVEWCNGFMSTQSTENGRSSNLKLPPKHDGAATHQVHTDTVEALDAIDRAPLCVVGLVPSSIRDCVRSWFRVRIWLVAFSGFFIDA